MKILKILEKGFFISIVPRFYLKSDLILEIREGVKQSKKIIEIGQEDISIIKGLLVINIIDFEAKADVKYTINVYHETKGFLWTGQALYTEKNITDYKLNNSDDKKYRF